MATSNTAPVAAINEGKITFKRVEGHKHDGITSSLIDTSKYSMFDFIASETNQTAKQQNNKNVLKRLIVSTIEERVLNPQGIRIQANAITAREIVSGTITADQLAANIILVNNAIRSNNYVSNSTIHTGWIINNTGNAEFNDVTIRGNLIAGDGFYNNSNTSLFANNGGYFSLKNKFSWDGANLSINASNVTLGDKFLWNGLTLTIAGDVLIGGTAASTIVSNADNAVQPSEVNGNVTSISGNVISTGTINLNNVNVRTGTTGARINIDSNGLFAYNAGGTNTVSIGSNGVASFSGTVTATAGSLGGWDINSSGIYKQVDIGGTIYTSTFYSTGDLSVFGLYNSAYASASLSPGRLTCYGDAAQTTIAGTRIDTGDIFARTGIYSTTLSANSASEGSIATSGGVNVASGFTIKATTAFYTSGSSTAARMQSTGGFQYLTGGSSLRALKENIKDLDNALGTILNLRPRTYNFKVDAFSEIDPITGQPWTEEARQFNQFDIKYGLIVEEVLETSPELISYAHSQTDIPYDEPGGYADISSWTPQMWEESDVIVLSVKAIQELSNKIASLESRIQVLEGV